MARKTWERVKDPDEIRDFGVEWEDDIGASTIAASQWTVVEGSVSVDDDTFADATTTARLSGGTLGEDCILLNHVTLANGEECEQTCRLKIRAR